MIDERRSASEVDTGLFYTFIGLVFWLPLPLGSNRPWAWSLVEFVSFGILIWWLILFLRKRIPVSNTLKNCKLPIGCLLFFCLVNLIQIIPLPPGLVASMRPTLQGVEPVGWVPLSVDSYTTWIHLRLSIAFTVISFLVMALVTTRKRLKTLALVMVVSGVFQAVYGSLMTLSGAEWAFLMPKEYYLGNATGTFVNRNHMANYLVMCLSMGTGLLLADIYQTSAQNWREVGRRLATTLLGSKFRLRVGLGMMVIALVLTRSRMGNSSFFLSLFVAGFLWLLITKRITKGSIVLLISLVAIDTLIVGTWFGLDQVKERLETTSVATESRVEVNRDTWTMIKDQPILGSGGGGYYTAFPRYRGQDITMTYDYAHNDYFQFLAEYGILGCAPLFIFLIAAITKTVQAMRRRKTLFYQAMAFAPLMAILAVLIHATVEFNMQMPANAATLLIIASLAWVLNYVPSKGAKSGLRTEVR